MLFSKFEKISKTFVISKLKKDSKTFVYKIKKKKSSTTSVGKENFYKGVVRKCARSARNFCNYMSAVSKILSQITNIK